MDENELLFDELYEKTKDCGRTQFIRLLMSKERENQQLKSVINKAQGFIREENSLNESEIDELSEILDSYR